MPATKAKRTHQRPTIIVRGEEPIGEAPHSSAWKIAYGDFVTAMMAFFLLMWLINATTEKQRRGLANYFSPSNAVSLHLTGSGEPFGGRTPFSSGSEVSDQGAVQAIAGPAEPEPNATPDARSHTPGSLSLGLGAGQNGRPRHLPMPARDVGTAKASPGSLPDSGPDLGSASGPAGPDVGGPALPGAPAPAPLSPRLMVAAAKEQATLTAAAAAVRRMITTSPALAHLSNHFAVDVTREGLRIQILDSDRRPRFALGSSALAPPARLFLARLAPILARLGNPVAISGYTDAAPYHGDGMTNWELSAERANVTRGLLAANGLPGRTIARVSGYADRDLLLPADPLAAANRRIAILVLRKAPASAPRTGATLPPR